MNAFLESYGAANNIPVINYGDMLCGCVGTVGGSGIGSVFNPPHIDPIPLMGASLIPSAAGYARMTEMAEATIDSLSGVKLESGWLNNVEATSIDIAVSNPMANVNRVATSAVLQFTPWGTYSNGVRRPLYNSNLAGSSGTWTSSDPYVMYVGQAGLAWAMSAGTAIIHYTSPTGVRFSEWIMTVYESE
jgi:hypothetical protein